MQNKYRLVTAMVITLLPLAAALAATGGQGKHGTERYGASVDNGVYIEVNNLSMSVSNVGSFAYDPTQSRNNKPDGLYYPNGSTRSVIYAGGIWIGALVNGSVRIAASEFSSEFVPGPMEDGSYQTDRGSYHVYKVNKGDNAEKNPDYANWPFDEGAPALKNASGTDSLDEFGNRIPWIRGDQVMFSVCNDANAASHRNHVGSTQPLGLEVRQYTSAMARGGTLGNVVFIRFVIHNRGQNQLKDTYVSLWCDPDVGFAQDDLVGCDTERSLGYGYNAGDDFIYGEAVPAVGYDFLQGPIVLSPGDTAFAFDTAIPGYRNLPMTSFNKYINGTDPQNATETFNYMQGLTPQGDTVRDPFDNPTFFQVSGDPVTGEGWVDDTPDDRRFMMSAGPFDMTPGDSQEVVMAVMVGQGADAHSSIAALKEVSDKTQAVYDVQFKIPFPPPAPQVWAQPHNRAVDLIWDAKADYDLQASDELGQAFGMEGYNVFQGESETGPWKRIATFDVANGVTLIYNDVRDGGTGGYQRQIVQSGSDNGLAHHLWINEDAINGGRLINHRPYHFAVTAYSFDSLNYEDYVVAQNHQGIIAEVLETRIAGMTVTPNSSAIGIVDTAIHVNGTAQGSVVIHTVDPYALTGDLYAVTFNDDLTWNLINTGTGDTVLSHQANFDGDYNYPVVDGIMVQTIGSYPDIEHVEWEGSEEPWLTSVFWGGRFYDGGFEIGRGFFGSSLDDTQLVDCEIRFSNTVGQKAYRYLRGAEPNYSYAGYNEVPLTAWDVSVDPPRQLNVCFVENVGLASEDQTWLPSGWGDGSNPGGREYLFILRSTYSEAPDEFYATHSVVFDAFDFDVMYAWWPLVADGHSSDELADGQLMRVTTNKFNTVNDRYEFVAYEPGDDPEVAGSTLDDVHPVPNPYFHGTDLEPDGFNRIIKFINLPAATATLTIYNLAGHRIRTIEKTDRVSTEIEWDVLTERRLPPASGIYIYHLSVPGHGEKVGKLAIFIDKEQLTTY